MFNYLTLVQVTQALRMILDIVIVWIILTYIIKIVRSNSKTTGIFKGVIFVIIIQAIAKYMGLSTLAYLTNTVVNWGFLALIIIFQPEIRSLLEKMGKTNVFTRMATLSGNEKEKLVQALMDAVSNLAATKTGALITLEQTDSLADFVKEGVPMNSTITAELLSSIFTTTTTLHDGAVIIQGDKIASASVYFPPTKLDLPARYGARHRAAIGISEITDSITIVVSEETGRVAIAQEGKLIQVNEKKLLAFLNRIILNKETVTSETFTQTKAESVSIDSLFHKESEQLRLEDKKQAEAAAAAEQEEEEFTTHPKMVVIIDENDERVVEEDTEVVHHAKMKDFKTIDFKADLPEDKAETVAPKVETPTIIKPLEVKKAEPAPVVKPLETVKTETKKYKNEEELKAEVQAEIQQALNSTQKFEAVEEKPKPKQERKAGLFSGLGKKKDKNTPKVGSVEAAVKDVAKEFHTTQQLKLRDIQEADEQAQQEEAKRRLEKTTRLVLPSAAQMPVNEKTKVKNTTNTAPIKPLEITPVNTSSSEEAKRTLSTKSLTDMLQKANKNDSKGGDK